ncbi:MAG: hypothetical protein AAGA03_07610, partial [Planctomycetota bacterium]
FDAVVLPELEGNLFRPESGSLSRAADVADRPEALTRSFGEKFAHFVDPAWQQAWGLNLHRGVTEALCLLYVAMTRARHGLYMMVGTASRKGYNYKHPASLVYHALNCEADASEPGNMLYEAGDPDWHQGITKATSLASLSETSDDSTSDDPRPIRFVPMPPVPRRNRPLPQNVIAGDCGEAVSQ